MVEPTNSEFDDDYFSVEYMSIFHVVLILVRVCESFSFDHIILDHLFEPSKSNFLEYDTFVLMTVDLG